MRFNDLDIPKEYKKKKKVTLYKAFILKDGDEMKVNTDIDILSLTHEASILVLITSLRLEDISSLKGKLINFAILEFTNDGLNNTDLIDNGDLYYQDLSFSITLKDKVYNVDVEDKLIEDIVIDIKENEIVEIRVLKLS
jgi:hypothetical protein